MNNSGWIKKLLAEKNPFEKRGTSADERLSENLNLLNTKINELRHADSDGKNLEALNIIITRIIKALEKILTEPKRNKADSGRTVIASESDCLCVVPGGYVSEMLNEEDCGIIGGFWDCDGDLVPGETTALPEVFEEIEEHEEGVAGQPPMEIMMQELGPFLTIDEVITWMGPAWEGMSASQKAELYSRLQQVHEAWQAPFIGTAEVSLIIALLAFLAIVLVAIAIEAGIAVSILAIVALILEVIYAGSSLMAIGAGTFGIMVGAIQRKYEIYRQRLALEGIDIEEWPENFLHLIGEWITSNSGWLVTFFEDVTGGISDVGRDIINEIPWEDLDMSWTHQPKF